MWFLIIPALWIGNNVRMAINEKRDVTLRMALLGPFAAYQK